MFGMDSPLQRSANTRAVTLSILTIVYNDLDGLMKTAQSVLVQEGFTPEWIVIDGGSTDGTAAAIASYSEAISYWHSRPDRGVYHAMNLALEHAKGDYVLFLNAGDALADRRVLADVANLLAISQPDLFFGAALLRFPSGLAMRHEPRDPDYIEHSLVANHQATFVKREWHERYPHDESFKISSDYLTTARMLSSQATSEKNVRLIAIRDSNSASVGASGGWRHYAECIRVQRGVLGKGWLTIGHSAMRRFIAKRCFHLIAGAKSPAAIRVVRCLFGNRLVSEVGQTIA